MRSGRWTVAAMVAALALGIVAGQPARAGMTDDLMDTTKHPVSVTMAMQADSFFGFNPAIGAENGPSQLLALKVVYALVPSVCILIAMRIAWNYPITEARHRRLRDNLAKRTQRRLAAARANAQ